MKGFPRHLNTRADYEYVSNHFPPEQWRPAWQLLLDGRYIWHTVGHLSADDPGVEDGTHRVQTEPDEEGRDVRYQQEWIEDPHAKIFRLGMTVAEVQAVLQGD